MLVDKLAGDERKEAEDREEEARVWISGLEAVKAKIGVEASTTSRPRPSSCAAPATPRARSSPGWSSDFSLIDAIESGIVKVPRVPVADDSMTGDDAHLPRPLAAHPRRPAQEGPQDRGRRPASRKLPVELEGALHSLYSNYEKYVRALGEMRERLREAGADARSHAAGLHRRLQQHQRLASSSSTRSPAGRSRCPTARRSLVPGKLPLFSNVEHGGSGPTRPNTILVDCEQLESGEAMSDEFKKIAAARDRGVQGRVPRPLPRPRRRRPRPTRTCCAR